MNRVSILPIFLNAKGRCCLVVGGGPAAVIKVDVLLQSKIDVRVVATQATEPMRLLAESKLINLHIRAYRPQDLEGIFLVIAATNDSELNQAILRDANSRNLFVNTVDDPQHCDFYFPAVVKRGPPQVAISTSGESPAFAHRLKAEIDSSLPNHLGDWLIDLGKVRRTVLHSNPSGNARIDVLVKLANRPILNGEPPPPPITNRSKCVGTTTVLSKIDPAEKGKVYLVGAGPGNPDLLTLRAATLLASSDIVLHDDLVSEEIRSVARPEAVLVNVGKRCGPKTITQEQIHSLMIRMAQADMSVVRLQSGDPLVFGRAGEEMDALREAEIPFEVVPGITSAFAAAAAAKVSLTDRRFSQSLAFCSGHRADRDGVRADANNAETQALYMPGKDLGKVAADWLKQGYEPGVPCVVVSCATRSNQVVVRTTLAQLASVNATEAPCVVLIGWALQSHHNPPDPTCLPLPA